MSRKIAPVLTALLADEWDRVKTPPPTREKAGDAQVLRIAGAELRAILAVVRGAEKVRRYVQESGYEGLEGPQDKAMFRALSRLSRLSAPKPRRGTTP